jgi:predicted dithiol-disulfide oxidoreductase (DUF899 family)
MATPVRKIETSRVVFPAEWLEARTKLLRKEKEFTRLRDELSRERRELPREKVEKEYVFDGPNGKEPLGELFGSKSQLIVYHFMLAPGWAEGCPGCSFLADHFDGSIPHLKARDVAFVAVSRAPLAEIEAFKKRMGWGFKWVSSNSNEFNQDYHVSFSKEELAEGAVNYNYAQQPFPREEGPGASAFYKDEAGNIYHTYSTYGRGLDMMIGAYNWLDIAPKGRDEEGLASPMSWVRHHDKYVDVAAMTPMKADASCCEHRSSTV